MFTEIKEVYLSRDYANPELVENQSDTTDVIIQMKNGEKYAASFFSYEFIQTWKHSQKDSDDFLNGKYFWVPNMVIVDAIDKQNILLIIQHMIDEGDFNSIFKKLI